MEISNNVGNRQKKKTAGCLSDYTLDLYVMDPLVTAVTLVEVE